MVWRETRAIGCARVTGSGNIDDYYETYILCSYYPAGNVHKKFPYNVLPKQPNRPDDFRTVVPTQPPGVYLIRN